MGKKKAISDTCGNYILRDPVLSRKYLFCTKNEKKWILEYLSSGKGAIAYGLVSDFDSLSLVTDEEFLNHTCSIQL